MGIHTVVPVGIGTTARVNFSLYVGNVGIQTAAYFDGNISVAGKLFIRNCPNLRELSAHIFVGHDISIYDCPGLKTVSGSICVRGSLFVNALGLIDVPGNLHSQQLTMAVCPLHCDQR